MSDPKSQPPSSSPPNTPTDNNKKVGEEQVKIPDGKPPTVILSETKETITISKDLFKMLQGSYSFIIANALNSNDKYDALMVDLNDIQTSLTALSQTINKLISAIIKEKESQKAIYRNAANMLSGAPPSASPPPSSPPTSTPSST